MIDLPTPFLNNTETGRIFFYVYCRKEKNVYKERGGYKGCQPSRWDPLWQSRGHWGPLEFATKRNRLEWRLSWDPIVRPGSLNEIGNPRDFRTPEIFRRLPDPGSSHTDCNESRFVFRGITYTRRAGRPCIFSLLHHLRTQYAETSDSLFV